MLCAMVAALVLVWGTQQLRRQSHDAGNGQSGWKASGALSALACTPADSHHVNWGSRFLDSVAVQSPSHNPQLSVSQQVR